jgi:hypothetical protein
MVRQGQFAKCSVHQTREATCQPKNHTISKGFGTDCGENMRGWVHTSLQSRTSAVMVSAKDSWVPTQQMVPQLLGPGCIKTREFNAIKSLMQLLTFTTDARPQLGWPPIGIQRGGWIYTILATRHQRTSILSSPYYACSTLQVSHCH